MSRATGRAVVVALVAALLLGACGVVPRERAETPDVKVAATQEQIESVLERYRDVRRTAASLLDAKPLSTVESGPVLAIDSGSFELAQRLGSDRAGTETDIDILQAATPRFAEYPLWFMAEVRDPVGEVNRVHVFERERASDPWFLVASPETARTTELPELRRRDGHALTVPPDSDTGMPMSPQAAADAYAAALSDPTGAQGATVADGDFRAQMQEIAEQNAALDGVTFSQTWTALPVAHVLRTADGGALTFATLERTDTYSVEEGRRVTWPEGSPQQAFLASGISDEARLTYLHQVLIHVPGGSDEPRILGQYGGVTEADGG